MPYEVIEHTADIKIRVWGDSLENLFSEAMLAMTGIMSIIPSLTIVQEGIMQRNVEVEAPDKTALLVDFLSEVLALSQTHKEVYIGVEFGRFSDAELMATLRGVKVNEFDEDIKAVTYHEADVKQNERGEWETPLVFDI